MENQSKEIWVFNGAKSSFPSGVFTNIEKAEEWIRKYRLTGVLTFYPVDCGVYDWAIDNHFFEAKTENEGSSAFIQRFTSASQQHFHYELGEKE